MKVRLDHPIGRCMELEAALRERYGLRLAEVVPSAEGAPELLTGVASPGAAEIERMLADDEPRIIALGTGRALKATVEQVERMDCPQHRIVSLLGNMMMDGQASPFNATVRMADRTGAPHYPMALPVYASGPEELAMLHAQEPVASTLALCAKADLASSASPARCAGAAVLDGFISAGRDGRARGRGRGGRDHRPGLRRQGAADRLRLLKPRVTGAPLEPAAGPPGRRQSRSATPRSRPSARH